MLYRIAQEALHNVVKHAAARRVRVDVRREGSIVRLRVEDDGKGFDPSTVPDGHLGLAGMRARAERVGAEFSCISAAGRGTTVEVQMGSEALAALEAAAGMRPAPRPTQPPSATDDVGVHRHPAETGSRRASLFASDPFPPPWGHVSVRPPR